MILIGGATGQLGAAVIAQLLKRGAKGRFAILARNAEKAKPHTDQGIEVRYADYDEEESLPAAFAGIDRFLFISTMSHNRGPQQKRVVAAAAAAGVSQIVYTGLAIRDIGTSDLRELMASHFETEDQIRASGMSWTILRNTIYADAIPEIAGPGVLQSGLALPAGAGRVPYALRSEMGEATANLLLQEGHAGTIYNLTANERWNFADVAEALTRLTGRNIGYRDISEDSLRTTLHGAGLADFRIRLTLGTLRDIRAGQYDVHSRDLETLLGRAPGTLNHMLQAAFSMA